MAKLLLVYVMVILALIYLGSATNYMVGDNSGWDISTDLDTWLLGKRFLVRDVLLFQFSTYHSVYEVRKENFDRCNITNTVKSSSKGNTRMKLHVNVEDNINKMASPAALPVPQAGASHFPTHSSKTNNPSTIVPRLTNLPNQVGLDSVLVATLGFPIDSFINMSNIRTDTTGLV
ncbi:hypothetical protein R3W88_008521 [Solanum pinnatisectum]|uniref:Phytocyanin domain-containing protein n=1 Tax=Solanum pinnatisectum TaxID=50273 RepID=A0AAV9M8A5_9SOLN|nr:hypothetical protein R3W88_008521 [Solanum pinnatisectum]